MEEIEQKENTKKPRLALHWQILIGSVAGLALGLCLRSAGRPEIATDHIAIIGTMFLRALKMVIVPLVFASLVTGVAGLADTRSLARLGGRTMLYYTGTSLLAILTGLMLVNLIAPGVGTQLVPASAPPDMAANSGSLVEILIRMIPANPIAAMANGDMLPTIFFALLFGIFAHALPGKQKQLIEDLFAALFALMMKMTEWIIRFAPLGVFALLAKTAALTGGDVFVPLAGYTLTVGLALAIHAFVSLPLLLKMVGHLAPGRHGRAMAPALLTAFSTASSSATLPLTMECAEKRAGIRNEVSGFVLPLGATINMDGTALYECVAALFIAQVYGVDLSMGQQFVVVITALLASIGAAGIPMAGLVMMTVILNAVGLPLEGIGLILAVDRILDMARTTVNVWSDSCGAAIIAARSSQ